MSPVLRPPDPTARARWPARWRGPLLLTVLVLLAHAALVLQARGPGSGPMASTVMQVRQIALPAADATPGPLTAISPATPPRQARGVGPEATSLRRSRVQPPPPAHGHPYPPATAVAVSPAPAASPEDPEAAPVYATRPPPTTTLRYTLQRGAQQGHAELQWQVDEGRYSLSLRSEIDNPGNSPGGNAVGNPGSSTAGPGSASVGRLDANGLAPDRHTESRRGRELRAVNFQRDTARVTFSGPRSELPLQAGAQDRLSWLLQLAAIAEANPALRAEGQSIRVFVIGTRGDAETWTFTVLGRDDLTLPVGKTANTLHLRREPQRLYDTHADVWLDPARQHLPVRVQLHLRPTGEGSEWQLEGQSGP